MSGFYLINYIRTIPVLLICLALKINEIIEEDLKRNLWYICSKDINLSSLNKNLLKNKCFRNIVYYRIHEKNKGLSLMFRILYPIKQDLEIYGQIGGLTIYHGHGTVINLYRVEKICRFIKALLLEIKAMVQEVRLRLQLEIMFQFAQMPPLLVELK